MRYLERLPHPALRADVECYWRLDDADPDLDGIQRIAPDVCVEVIVHAGTPFRHWPELAAEIQPAAFAVGSMRRFLAIQATGPVRTWGIRFRPGGAYVYFGVPVRLLADRVTALADLWGSAAAQLEDGLRASAGFEAAAPVIDRALRARLGAGRPGSAPVGDAVARTLAGRGCVSVEALARATGWTRRHLERRFHEEVGVPPKTLARVARLNAAFRLRDAAPDSGWAELALEAGFADQSHLIRDFAALAGATPVRGTSPGAIAGLFVSQRRLEAYFGA
jgi:AraC-like DNA-binding protein